MPVSIDRLKDTNLRENGLAYMKLAEAVIEDIETGRLSPGERLPTHRELSELLGLSLGTITRALAKVSQQGMIEARPRRGTFVTGRVRRSSQDLPATGARYRRFVDLGTNTHVPQLFTQRLSEALSELAKDDETLHELDHYLPTGGLLRHRQAGGEWLAQDGFEVAPDQVLICDGTQNALAAVLLSLSRTGDTILTEELTYPGLHPIADALGLRLVGLPMDEEGLMLDGLQDAVAKSEAKFLFCIPTLQTPTCAIMSEQRRKAIAKLVLRHDLFLIEDNVYADMLPDRPKPISAYCRNHSALITSFSKIIAQGLRVGFIVAAQSRMAPLRGGLQSMVFTGPNLLAEIACRWLNDGTAAELVRNHRQICDRRSKIAAEYLGKFDFVYHPFSSHSWLSLEGNHDPKNFNARCNSLGIGLRPSDDFAIAQGVGRRGVRITLGAAQSDAELRSCVSKIRGVLDEDHIHQELRA